MSERRATAGFTLIEMMVTITIIAVMAAVLFHQLRDDAQLRVTAASRLLTSDIEYAQITTIGNPADPVVVRFVPAQGKYWLARASDADTPIARPSNGAPYMVTFGVGQARMTYGVLLQLTSVTNDTLVFNAQGGVGDPSITPEIRLFHGLRWINLTISPTTGSISHTMGVD